MRIEYFEQSRIELLELSAVGVFLHCGGVLLLNPVELLGAVDVFKPEVGIFGGGADGVGCVRHAA